MPLLVSEDDETEARALAVRAPYRGASPSFLEAFIAGRTAQADAKNANVREASRYAIQDEYRRQFYELTGQPLRRWLGGPGVNPIEDRETEARNQVEAIRAERPELEIPPLPTNDEIEEEWKRRARLVLKDTEEVTGRVEGFWPSAGQFLGTAAGAMQDPINLMALPFGAGRTLGILGTALVEGGISATSEAGIQAFNYGARKEIDPNYSVGDALYEVGAAGAGGAILGGGIKGLADGWARLSTGEWPSHVRDAGNVVMREAAVPSSRFQRSAAGDQAHREAFEKAADDLIRGRPVEIPQEAFFEANVRPNRVYDADGRSVGVRYELAELDSLIPSNRDDLSINPDFPQELQPRDRSRAMSQDQVSAIAGNLQPERLGFSTDAGTGAPIIGPDDFVESGNGRVLALRRAYQAGGAPAESYKNFLRAQSFDLDGFHNPVLIARRVTDLEDRVGFVTAANRSTTMRLGAAEQALSDARLLDGELLDRLQGSDVAAAANTDFVRGFMRGLPRAEQAALVDAGGKLSQEGTRRIGAALMGRAYGDAALLGRALEDSDNNIRTIAGAMSDASGAWARMRDAVARGEIPAGMDLTDDLLNAVRMVMRARDEGRPVAELIDQGEMFGGLDEMGKLVARAMFTEDMRRPLGRARLKDFLEGYAEEARKNLAGERLFGEPLESRDIMKTSLEKSGREDLKRVADERLTPEAMEKLAEAPDLDDAVIQEANRVLAERQDIQIDIGDGDQSLDSIFDAADAEIAAAKQIEACATGLEAAE